MKAKRGLFERIGADVRIKASNLVYAVGYSNQVLRETIRFFGRRRRQVGFKSLVMQILFTGYEALWVISLLSLALGAIIIIQGFALLPQFGQGGLMYQLLVIIITRELGPVLTAFIIIARSGTAIATELAGMVVNQEVEAYIAFGMNPLSFLVVPRLLGVVVSMFILTIYFNIFGLVGSWFVAAFVTSLPFGEYGREILKALGPGDVAISLIKALIFGFIVSMVSTFQGFSVNRSSTEVPVAGIKAVTRSFIYCILADAVLSILYYILK